PTKRSLRISLPARSCADARCARSRQMMHATPIVGAVMDIVVWLRSLGLGKYEAAFRENEIDERVLPNLTAEDLKELGVSIVGHRRILLDAIAALRTNAAGTGPSVAA